MRINFDITDLEAFLAVKETGSFHSASKKLNLSQPAITRRIQKLEGALGTILFERTTRDVRPTLAAKRLQERAQAIVDDVFETARAMRDESTAFRYQRQSTVTVATIPTVISPILVPALRAVQADNSNLRFRLIDLAANEVAEAVALGEADVGICSIPLVEPSTEFEPLFTDPICLAIPPKHKLARPGPVSWSELDGETLILPARGTGNRLLIDDALASAEISVKWTFEVGRTSTAVDLVAGGVGVSPLPRLSLSSVPSGNVEMRSLVGPAVARPIGVLRRYGQGDRPETAALIAEIRTALGQLRRL